MQFLYFTLQEGVVSIVILRVTRFGFYDVRYSRWVIRDVLYKELILPECAYTNYEKPIGLNSIFGLCLTENVLYTLCIYECSMKGYFMI